MLVWGPAVIPSRYSDIVDRPTTPCRQGPWTFSTVHLAKESREAVTVEVSLYTPADLLCISALGRVQYQRAVPKIGCYRGG